MKTPMGSAKSNKSKAMQTERNLAKELRGKAVPASGAIDGMKGDVSTDDYLIDSKETGGKSIMVTSTMLNKISKEAREAGKRPALVVKLGPTQIGVAKQWAVIPLQDFKELISDD